MVADGAVWQCTSYDTRGRTAQQYFPAWGGFAARTVTYNYRPAYGTATADPSVTKTTDDSLPVGQRDTWSKVDLLGRQVEYVDVWGTKTVTSYDVAGRVSQAVVTVGGSGVHTMAYGYNASGSGVNQLSTVTYTPSGGAASVLATVSYDAIGRQAGITYANGTAKTAPSFDSYQRATTNAFTQAGGSALTSTTTTFDIAGRVKHQVVDGLDPTPGTDTYSYDAAGRLTGFVLPTPGGTATASYNYTATQAGTCSAGALATGKNSNRVSRTYTPPGGSATTYNACYDHADRVTTTNEVGFNSAVAAGYDVHGNMVTVPASGSTETHVFDIADRHLSTKIGATTTVAYTRDATDRPVLRTEGATTVRYGYSGAGDSSSLVLSTTNNIVERTISLPGGVMVTTRAGGNVWFYPNTHGDIAATTNNAGVKQGATVFYDPTGNVISGTTPDSSSGNWDFAWHGTAQRPLEHATGLMPIIEMGARQYQSTLGRFLEVDPIEGGTPNDYAYVWDPVNQSDLNGKAAWGICAGIKINPWWIVITGQVCFWLDDHGDTLFTFTAGLGVGKNQGWAIEGQVSSVHHVRWLLGFSGCASVSFEGRKSGGACAFKGPDDNWYSTWSAGGGTRGWGADASAGYTFELPSMFRRTARRALRKAGCDLSSRKRLARCKVFA